ncbi:MAG: hypothetical protein M9962_10120, partial [Oligoflexia bacterium]|nr:hypothetical protein [Oligoflexia bacterium]
ATPTEFEVFSSIDKFILSLKKIIQDPALWQNIQHLCLNRIREFSPSEDKSRFSKILEIIYNQSPIDKISKKVIQNVLMSNEHSATKYFSKWIELKNNRSTASLDS